MIEKTSNGYFDLELKIDKCKFFPLKPMAVVAGDIITKPTINVHDTTRCTASTKYIDRTYEESQNKTLAELEYAREKLNVGTRCLVYVHGSSAINFSVDSLIERWANECREKKKCTNWIAIAEHKVTCQIDIEANSTKSIIESCRNIPGAWMLRSSLGISKICDPPTLRVTMMMDQSKFYPTKLAILDGTIRDVCRDVELDLKTKDNENLLDLLESGERCWLHVRSNVVSLLKTLHGDTMAGIERYKNDAKGGDGSQKKTKISTGWVQLARSIPITCRIIINDELIQKKSNVKGALLLECFEVIDVQKDRILRNGINQAFHNDKITPGPRLGRDFPVPIRADRKERHRIFAEWLVKVYGVDFLSTGSGVLDVAGGNGVLGMELWKFGVKSTLLDPEPRCDVKSVPFQVISKALSGDGSELTEVGNEDITEINGATDRARIKDLVETCSIIAGMHPDQATEAVVDTSLRLGKLFAILPCCVFRNLNFERQMMRKQKQQDFGGTDPFRSYSTFCNYLLRDKAPAGMRFQTVNLPFEGRNKVVFMPKDAYLCKEITYE